MTDNFSITTRIVESSLKDKNKLPAESIIKVKKRLEYITALLKKLPPPDIKGEYILIVRDKKPLKWFSLSEHEGKNITIGRNNENIVALEDLSVSRYHCIIRKKENNWIIADNNSRNGVYVNGKKYSCRELSDGDLIKIGDFHLIFIEQFEEMKK